MTHLDRVKALPCVLCGLIGLTQRSVTDAHHIRAQQGLSQRANDFLTIPLCHAGCHQGPMGVHGDRSLLAVAKTTETDLLALTLMQLYCAPVTLKPTKRQSAPKRKGSTDRPSKLLPRRVA